MFNNNSINFLELEDNYLNDSNSRQNSNKDFIKKSIFSNSINNSNSNFENDHLKQSSNFLSKNIKSRNLSSSKLNISADNILNSCNNSKKSYSPDQKEVLDYNSENLKSKFLNKAIKNIKDNEIQNQNMTINIIKEDMNDFNVNIVDPVKYFHIEKTAKCIDQSFFCLFSKKKMIEEIKNLV